MKRTEMKFEATTEDDLREEQLTNDKILHGHLKERQRQPTRKREAKEQRKRADAAIDWQPV